MNNFVKKQAISWSLGFAVSSLRALAQKLEELGEDGVAEKVDDIRSELVRVVKKETKV